MWIWIAVGLGAFLSISALIGLVFARVLRTLRDASELLETGTWVTRTADTGAEVDDVRAAPTRVEQGARPGNKTSPAAALPPRTNGSSNRLELHSPNAP